MISLLVVVLLSQSQVTVRNTGLAAPISTRCVNAAGTAFESCGGAAGPGGSSWSPDGGAIGSVSQGAGYDGGAWRVYVEGQAAGAGAVTNSELRASPINVLIDGGSVNVVQTTSPWVVSGAVTTSGTATVTQATGTNLHVVVDAAPSTAVTGPLTDTQLRASVVPVSLTSTTVTGSVAVTGPATDTQLRATPLPVSGTITASVTDATLAAGSAIIGKVGIDQTTPGTTNLVALAANQSVNVAQINGVAPLMGTGATGTGSQRVTLATNSPGFSTSGGTIAADSELQASRAVAYGSSPTSIAATTQAPQISDLEGRPYVNIGHPRAVHCTFAAAATATLLELTGCAAVASNSYYITSWRTCGGIANAATVPALLRSGTGTNCGTGTVTLDTCWHGTAGCCEVFPGTPIKVTQAHAICGIDATVGTKSFTLQGYIAP